MKTEGGSQIYAFDGFWIDASKRRLMRETGEAVMLTPKVFDTLLYLATNAGRVVEKEELLREIWVGTIVEENSLNKNISVLRQVLGEKHGDNRFIATVPGRGYKFVSEVIEENSRGSAGTAEESKQRSVAVLPFKPVILEHRSEALEMGMADTLIARLGGKNHDIVFRPLAAVRKYNSLDQDPLAAGRELGVDSVLDGSIQHVGEKVRVNLRLMKTSDGTSLWSGTLDENFTDILALQDSIAERVAATLEIQLGDRKNKHSTKNVEAYQCYVRGRFHVAKLTPGDMQTGIANLQRAIEIDPSYALAYVGLADAYHRLSVGGELPSHEFLPMAKEAARKAIKIDDTLAEAYTLLGWLAFWYDWDWKQSENYCRRALELDPNLSHAHEAYAHLLANTARHAEALDEIRRARELNPTSPFVNALEGQFMLHAGMVDESMVQLGKTLELDQHFWLVHLFVASARIENQEYSEAFKEAEMARELSHGSSHAAAFAAYALAKAGKQGEARNVLDKLVHASSEQYIPPYHIALIYNALGEIDQAIESLERGYEVRDPKMTFLMVEPKWNNLRSDRRFIDLMRRMRFD